ncbi:MAG: PAS domain S-box protein [Gallionella sp.]|nr:PAS domain S-box protein [Gallionella sp.]
MNSPHKPLHVLLVEDSQDDADLILLELREAGFDVVCKRVDTEAAMREAMMDGRWDIVISDFGLPKFSAHDAMAVLHESDFGIQNALDNQLQHVAEIEVSGWKIKRKNTISLMQKDERRSCPFIIVSGCIGEESAIAMMKEGASDFVMKDKLSRLVPVIERELKDAITRQQHRQAQDALRANEKLLKGITSALGEGLIVLNNEGELLFMNPEAERLLGWSERELSGCNVHEVIHSQRRDGTDLPESDCGVLGVLKKGGAFKTENDVFWRKDGLPISVSIIATAIMENGQAVASVVAFQDISQRKQAERELLESREQLRELSAHQLSVREEERTRIARELHDELGQMLTGVKLDAMWLASRLSGEQPSIVDKVASMSKLIDETLDAMRRVAADLRPVMLDDLGLEAAIEWLSEEFGKHSGLAVQLELDVERGQRGYQGEDCDLDSDVTTAIFRIVQECLTNIARHAEAEHVLISLDCHDGKLMLLLSDDGKGIPATGNEIRKSYGIVGMRERAHNLGGTLHLLSIPGEGTTVVAIIPVKPIGFAGATQ